MAGRDVTIESLTTDLESVRKIYEVNYYRRGKANLLPHTLAFAHFDVCVNLVLAVVLDFYNQRLIIISYNHKN